MSTESDMITGNLYGFYKRIAESCGYERGKTGGCDFVWNKEGSWPGYLFGIPEPERIPEIIDSIKGELAPAFWILDDSNHEVNRLLEENGVRPVRQWEGMILGPGDFRPASKDFQPADDDPSIRIVADDPDTLEEWLQIVNTELLTGAEIGEEVLEVFKNDSAFQWMVAFYDNRPVSTGLLFSEGGVVGVYMVATRTEFRGLGVGSAVTSELTDAAFRTGNHAVVLHATNMAGNIYRRAGFRKVNRYSISWYLG